MLLHRSLHRRCRLRAVAWGYASRRQRRGKAQRVAAYGLFRRLVHRGQGRRSKGGSISGSAGDSGQEEKSGQERSIHRERGGTATQRCSATAALSPTDRLLHTATPSCLPRSESEKFRQNLAWQRDKSKDPLQEFKRRRAEDKINPLGWSAYHTRSHLASQMNGPLCAFN